MLADLYNLADRFSISDEGQVFAKAATRTRSDGVVRHFKGHAVPNRVNEYGYTIVGIYDGLTTKVFKVHRLVLLSFNYIANHHELDVNHKDGNKSNNCLNNLEWATRSENLIHSYRVLGRVGATTGKFGKDHHRAMSVKATLNGVTIHEFDSLMDAQRAGFSASCISRCIYGDAKRHKGMEWVRITLSLT